MYNHDQLAQAFGRNDVWTKYEIIKVYIFFIIKFFFKKIFALHVKISKTKFVFSYLIMSDVLQNYIITLELKYFLLNYTAIVKKYIHLILKNINKQNSYFHITKHDVLLFKISHYNIIKYFLNSKYYLAC